MARAEFLFDFASPNAYLSQVAVASLQEAGIDASALHKRSQDADVKADLMASTEDAAKRDVEEALAG